MELPFRTVSPGDKSSLSSEFKQESEDFSREEESKPYRWVALEG
jgi:hypothetical protein